MSIEGAMFFLGVVGGLSLFCATFPASASTVAPATMRKIRGAFVLSGLLLLSPVIYVAVKTVLEAA